MFALHISLSQPKIYFKYQHIAIFNTKSSTHDDTIFVFFSENFVFLINDGNDDRYHKNIVFGRVRDYI